MNETPVPDLRYFLDGALRSGGLSLEWVRQCRLRINAGSAQGQHFRLVVLAAVAVLDWSPARVAAALSIDGLICTPHRVRSLMNSVTPKTGALERAGAVVDRAFPEIFSDVKLPVSDAPAPVEVLEYDPVEVAARRHAMARRW